MIALDQSRLHAVKEMLFAYISTRRTEARRSPAILASCSQQNSTPSLILRTRSITTHAARHFCRCGQGRTHGIGFGYR